MTDSYKTHNKNLITILEYFIFSVEKQKQLQIPELEKYYELIPFAETEKEKLEEMVTILKDSECHLT